jgi:RsbT co-antagonist protein rsbRD N-terminal domain
MSQTTIADQIESHIGHLIEAWTVAVREDPRIQSDENLTKPELIDHVPAILEEICELIRKREIPGVRNSLEARANVYVRFHQGYTGRDLVRELSLLRITLLDYLMELSLGGTVDLNSEERHEAGKIINLYLDEEMRYAISVFCNPPSLIQAEQ